MAVLLYQIGIFLAINIASLFGKKARNTAVILISIFTILQVFMSWLLLLQFVTIFLAYSLSNNFLEKKTQIEKKPKSQEIRETEFRDTNQRIEYAELSRKHTANRLTEIRAPSKPHKPYSPDSDKPQIQSRLIYVILLLVITAILSYILPLGFLVSWLEEVFGISKLQFLTFCGIIFTIIQFNYYQSYRAKFKKRSERYKNSLDKYNEKLRQYNLDLREYETKNKSSTQIKIENAELERRMNDLRNNAY